MEVDAFLNRASLGEYDEHGLYTINFLVAIYDGQVIGFSGWSVSLMADDVYELCWSAVRGDFRHCGVNTKMVACRLEDIRNDFLQNNGDDPEYDKYVVQVRTWDNAMYRGFGFKSTGIRFSTHKEILAAEFPIHR